MSGPGPMSRIPSGIPVWAFVILLAADCANASKALPPLGLGSSLATTGHRVLLSLRGGVADRPALTEEDEAAAMNLSHPGNQNLTNSENSEHTEASAVERFAEHLQQVEANPAEFIPCPLPGCLRFLSTTGVPAGTELTCECQTASMVLEAEVAASFAVPARNIWRRLYPLDLAAFVPSVVDSEDLYGEESEVVQARSRVLPSAANHRTLAGSLKLRLRDGSSSSCHLQFANESSAVVAWSYQPNPGQESWSRVDRVRLSESDSNGSVTVTWTSALPVSTPAAVREAIREDKAAALRRLQVLLGCAGEPKKIAFFGGCAEGGATADGEEEEKYGAEGAEVLDLKRNAWVAKGWGDLREGQIVRVNKTQHFPADLLLLHASTPSEVCVETSCIDGDASLRQWQVVPMSFTSEDSAARQASGKLHTEFDVLGNGEPEALEGLKKAGHLLVAQNRLPSEWESWWTRFVPRGESKAAATNEKASEPAFGYRQLLLKNGRLLVTEWVIGVVVFTGRECTFALNGGWGGQGRLDRRRRRQEEEEKARKEAVKKAQLAALSDPVQPEEYERETGVRWQARFVDVPDDGNCLMHAVWLGLSTLLRHYPALKEEGEAALAGNALEFRAQALKRMAGDRDYREAVKNQLQLWLSVECELLFGLEDFFCLPPDFQAHVVELNQAVQMGGHDIAQVDFDGLVDQYVNSLSQVQVDSGRNFYLPLGDLELDALCRIFRFRLQVVKTEALDVILEASEKVHSNGAAPDALPPAVGQAIEGVKSGGAGEAGATEALETVLLFLNNILDNPSDPKFSTIKAANPAFQRRVAAKPGATDLLLACGFALEEGGAGKMYCMERKPPWLAAAARLLLETLHPGDVTRIVDPRTIRKDHIYDRNQGLGRRVVRILNVKTNHYQVHLPRPPQ